MSKDSSQGPPVVPVSRPLTFSSGLWNAHDTNSPVKLPPLHIPLRASESSTSGPTNSTAASPVGSSIPSLESRLDVAQPSRHGYASSSSREALERPPQEWPPHSPDHYQNPSRYHPREGGAGSNAPVASRHINQGEAQPFQPGVSAPPPPPSSYHHPDIYRGPPPHRPPPHESGPGHSADFSSHAAASAGSGSHVPPRLLIRQQPIAARACGFGERDRRLVDPPPILQLSNTVGVGDPDTVMSPYSPTSFAVVQASLWDESGQYDVTFAQPTNRKPGGRLMGTTFTTSINAKDDADRDGIFFAFSDLSCRTYGRFRLRFALMIIDSAIGRVGTRAPVVDYAMSDPFTVYSASDFPGMRPSSRLTKALRESGCAIPVKKGRRSVFGTTASDEEGEEEEASSKRTKRSKNPSS